MLLLLLISAKLFFSPMEHPPRYNGPTTPHYSKDLPSKLLPWHPSHTGKTGHPCKPVPVQMPSQHCHKVMPGLLQTVVCPWHQSSPRPQNPGGLIQASPCPPTPPLLTPACWAGDLAAHVPGINGSILSLGSYLPFLPAGCVSSFQWRNVPSSWLRATLFMV